MPFNALIDDRKTILAAVFADISFGPQVVTAFSNRTVVRPMTTAIMGARAKAKKPKDLLYMLPM